MASSPASLRFAQRKAQERINTGDIVTDDGKVSEDVYILGINIDTDLPNEDIRAFADVEDKKITLEDFRDWRNKVDKAVNQEARSRGYLTSQPEVSMLDPNWVRPHPPSKEYRGFFNRHPRERFVKWLTWYAIHTLALKP